MSIVILCGDRNLFNINGFPLRLVRKHVEKPRLFVATNIYVR